MNQDKYYKLCKLMWSMQFTEAAFSDVIFHILRKDLAVLEKASHSRDEFHDMFLPNKSDAAVIDVRCD